MRMKWQLSDMSPQDGHAHYVLLFPNSEKFGVKVRADAKGFSCRLNVCGGKPYFKLSALELLGAFREAEAIFRRHLQEILDLESAI